MRGGATTSMAAGSPNSQWPASTLSLIRCGYIESAKTRGVQGPKVVLRHVLANWLTPVMVQALLDAGGIILHIAPLSYLRLDISQPTAERES